MITRIQHRNGTSRGHHPDFLTLRFQAEDQGRTGCEWGVPDLKLFFLSFAATPFLGASISHLAYTRADCDVNLILVLSYNDFALRLHSRCVGGL
jgi:hypothetical protein